jgi:hypothetical protein
MITSQDRLQPMDEQGDYPIKVLKDRYGEPERGGVNGSR